MNLSATLKKASKAYQTPIAPIWGGPSGEGTQGGVTYSLLSRYLADRERFRLMTVEGIKPADSFSHRMEFGSMWHVCERAVSAGPKFGDWQSDLLGYAKALCHRYRLDQDAIDTWHGICKVEFPIYLKFWQDHPDEKERTPLLQEQVFDVSYPLPSGRKVRLRGKWDGVDLIGKGKEAGVYLLEHKTKSDPNEQQIKRQLSFDLQTMKYVISLSQDEVQLKSPFSKLPLNISGDRLVKGVRYNVVKRPRQYQGKKESKVQFLERLSGIIAASPVEFFSRYRVEVSANDVARFKRECLDPVLENLCDDYEWWTHVKDQSNAIPSRTVFDYQDRERLFPHHTNRHYREPYGVWNPLDEGRSGDLDEFLATGSMVGLQRVTTLFQELEE